MPDVNSLRGSNGHNATTNTASSGDTTTSDNRGGDDGAFLNPRVAPAPPSTRNSTSQANGINSQADGGVVGTRTNGNQSSRSDRA